MNPLLDLVRRLWGRERALAWTGTLGVALGIGCAAAIVVRGSPFVSPEGDLEKAASFDLAIGVFVLTLAALLPHGGFGSRGKRVWRWATVVAIHYFYLAETVATLRGLDPRFSAIASGGDAVVAALFGLDSVLVTVLFLTFAASFFTRRADLERPALVLGVRWASAAALLAFGVGFWMIALQGREVGLEGSALPPHALGFHALQAVPLVGWLVDRQGHGRGRVHLAGALWVAATVSVAAQTVAGRPPLAADPPTLLAGLFLAAWAAVVLASLGRSNPESPRW